MSTMQSLWWAIRGGLAVSVVAVLLQVKVAAQDPVEAPLLDRAQRYGIIIGVRAGRLHVTGGMNRGSRSMSSSNTRCKERLIMVGRLGGDATITYEQTGATYKLLMELRGSGHVRIQRTPVDNAVVTAIEFVQEPNKPLVFILGADSAQRTFRAESLWHLIFAHQECREHLVPYLRLLLRDWNVMTAAEALKTNLLRLAVEGAPADRKCWDEWVAQLAADEYSKREAADRRLRAAGQTILVYLRRLDPDKLDAEQRFRIRRIIVALSLDENESVELTALRLFDDPMIWLALLADDKESVRRVAAKRLAVLLGRPIQFDPSATPQQRQKQIEPLRKQFTPPVG